jgi:hypothetical protein
MQENERSAAAALQHCGLNTVDVESPLTDREIRQEPFPHDRDPTLGEIADDLAISRTTARNPVLEYRARQAGRRSAWHRGYDHLRGA